MSSEPPGPVEARINRVYSVSVVVPAYGVTENISKRLSSVFSQRFSDFEVIVGNNVSPDTPAPETALTNGRHRRMKQS